MLQKKIKIIKPKDQIREQWMIVEIKNASKRLSKLYHKCMRKAKDNDLYQEYIFRRNNLNYLRRKAKSQYYNNKIQEFKNDCKMMWSLLNNIIGKHRNKNDCVEYINVNEIRSYNTLDISN